MERSSSGAVRLLVAVAVFTVFAVGADLYLSGAPRLADVLLGLGLFLALLPWWPWFRGASYWLRFGLLLADGALVAAGMWWIGRTGSLVILFFVLMPYAIGLPRQARFVLYGAFLAATVARMAAVAAPDWPDLARTVAGFAAVAAFSESFALLRKRSQETQKVLDELIAAQKRLAGETVVGESVAGETVAGGPAGTATAPAAAGAGGAADGPAAGGGPSAVLTRRDREVLGLVAMGFSNKEIAERLFLAEGSVKNRVSAILDKIGARDRTQAALKARDLGLL